MRTSITSMLYYFYNSWLYSWFIDPIFYVILRLSSQVETLCLPVLGDAHTRVLVLRAPTAAPSRPAAPSPSPHIHMLPAADDGDARSYVSAPRSRSSCDNLDFSSLGKYRNIWRLSLRPSETSSADHSIRLFRDTLR